MQIIRGVSHHRNTIADFMTKFRHAVNRCPRPKFTLRFHPHSYLAAQLFRFLATTRFRNAFDHRARLFSHCAMQKTDRRSYFHTQRENIRGRISFFQELRTRTQKCTLAHALHLTISGNSLKAHHSYQIFNTTIVGRQTICHDRERIACK
jgi:hypothetical protein